MATLWGSFAEKWFILIMLEEKKKGNMLGGKFSRQSWKKMLGVLNSKSRRNFTLKQMKQKFNRLRIQHREFAALLNHIGFCWDANANFVQAQEETWQKYVKARPYAKRFRRKGCQHYEFLGLIFNKSTTTGVAYLASSQDSCSTHDLDNELEDESSVDITYQMTHALWVMVHAYKAEMYKKKSQFSLSKWSLLLMMSIHMFMMT